MYQASAMTFIDLLATTDLKISLTDLAVLHVFDELTRRSRRISISLVMDLTRRSRRTVEGVLRRYRGAVIQWAGEVGKANHYRVELPNLGQSAPAQPLLTSADEPAQPLRRSDSPDSLPSQGQDLKSFKSLRGVKSSVGGLSDRTPPSSCPPGNGEPPAGFVDACSYARKLCGEIETTNPPVLPQGDLKKRIARSVESLDTTQCLDAILAQHAALVKKNRPFSSIDVLKWAFPPLDDAGKVIWPEVDLCKVEGKARIGKKIRLAAEKKTEVQERKAEPVADRTANALNARFVLDTLFGARQQAAAAR